MQHSAIATSDPALGDVVGGGEVAAADALAHALMGGADRRDVLVRQCPSGGAAVQLRDLRPVARGLKSPTSAMRSPELAKPSQPARRASGSLPTMPITGVGRIGPSGDSL